MSKFHDNAGKRIDPSYFWAVGRLLTSDRRCDIDLMQAVFDGDYAAAEKAIELGADPNWRLAGYAYGTPLIRALADGSISLAALMVKSGADVRMAHPEGSEVRPLLVAVMEKAGAAAVRLLLAHGADPLQPLPGGSGKASEAEPIVAGQDPPLVALAVKTGQQGIAASIKEACYEALLRQWGGAPAKVEADLEKENEILRAENARVQSIIAGFADLVRRAEAGSAHPWEKPERAPTRARR